MHYDVKINRSREICIKLTGYPLDERFLKESLSGHQDNSGTFIFLLQGICMLNVANLSQGSSSTVAMQPLENGKEKKDLPFTNLGAVRQSPMQPSANQPPVVVQQPSSSRAYRSDHSEDCIDCFALCCEGFCAALSCCASTTCQSLIEGCCD